MTDELVKFENLSESALRAEIEIKATPERVYAAWTKAEQFAKWFGPRVDGHLQVDTFDCSVGGRYDVTMVFLDGDRFQIVGQFQELDPPRKLVLTWQAIGNPTTPEETLVTVYLVPSEVGTLVRLTHERFISAEARDGHQQGWASLLSRLATVLAG